jgi:hypothetical protein
VFESHERTADSVEPWQSVPARSLNLKPVVPFPVAVMNFDLTEEQRLLEQSIRQWGAREVSPKIRDLDREHRFDKALIICKGAVIYEGTREIHTVMQADYVLGFRQDKPLRCELPKYD